VDRPRGHLLADTRFAREQDRPVGWRDVRGPLDLCENPAGGYAASR
jgi:hypothetical protein